jgi:hypothetical protein
VKTGCIDNGEIWCVSLHRSSTPSIHARHYRYGWTSIQYSRADARRWWLKSTAAKPELPLYRRILINEMMAGRPLRHQKASLISQQIEVPRYLIHELLAFIDVWWIELGSQALRICARNP